MASAKINDSNNMGKYFDISRQSYQKGNSKQTIFEGTNGF